VLWIKCQSSRSASPEVIYFFSHNYVVGAEKWTNLKTKSWSRDISKLRVRLAKANLETLIFSKKKKVKAQLQLEN
jgi:hypothetical protein